MSPFLWSNPFTGGAGDIDPLARRAKFQGMTILANSRDGYPPKAMAFGRTTLETMEAGSGP